MLEQQRHIDLHLPKGWNQCTTDELEHIAAAIILCQQRVDRYHPFDWAQVKLMAVLSINDIKVISGPEYNDLLFPDSLPSEDDNFTVRRHEDTEPWPITLGQLHALTEQLSWIDDEKADKTVFQFPYPEIDVRCKKEEGRGISHHPSSIIHLQGPPPLLDGYSWQEYRWLTDWMQEYMRCENAKRDSTTARNEFLAILFKPAGKPTGTVAAEHTSAISHLTSDIFEGFSPVRWQVILFWWSSLMAILARKFPKVFKQQPVGKRQRQQKADTPWDFYNRVIATIQKYVGGLSEENVNHASYGTILQQLEMMAREAEEMDRISKKKH